MAVFGGSGGRSKSKTTNKVYKESACYGSKGVFKSELLNVSVPKSQSSAGADSNPTHGPKTPKVGGVV